tara:strand:- start:10189 stop:10893 length:705 start_codon:yes stop_codon:yes gene_type:complete
MKTILLPAALCVIVLLVFSCVMDSAMADNDVTSSGATDIDQANSTGSNTSISGGYNSEATTNYQSGSSANTTSTTNNTTNAYTGDSRVVPSASAPSISSMSQDLCTVGISAGGQTFSFGASLGFTKRDLNCERLKLAKALYDMNMKVAAIAIMCQDSRVFAAMHSAGTYCPYDGSIGADAKGKWEKYGKLRPDYEEYVKTLRITEQIDNQILKDMDDGQVINYSGGSVKLGNDK